MGAFANGVTRWWRGDGRTPAPVLERIRVHALILGLKPLQLDAAGIRVLTDTDAEQRAADKLDKYLRKIGELI